MARNLKQSITFIPGSFRPPHIGHMNMIEYYSKITDYVVIIISDPKKHVRTFGEKDNKMSAEQSKLILDTFIACYNLNNIKCIISNNNSPIKDMMSFISSIGNCDVVIGTSNKFNDTNKYKWLINKLKRNNITIKTGNNYNFDTDIKISASEIRQHFPDFSFYKKYLPPKLSNNDIKTIKNIFLNIATQLNESNHMKNNKSILEFQPKPPKDEFECASLDISDKILNNAKVFAYMCDQTIVSDKNEKPYTPKMFPSKAINIILGDFDNFYVSIFFDTKTYSWDSEFIYDNRKCKLSPDQMEKFFCSVFYQRLLKTLEQKWPLSENNYKAIYNACLKKQMKIDPTVSDVISENEVNQPHKRKKFANTDLNLDGKRDYTSTGRKIVDFSDIGINSKSGEYYCWPNPKMEFKWSQWKDWKKIKPFAKMTFKHNDRRYGISLSLFDENFENRGFRGFDIDWKPPLAWLTPGECKQIMNLTIVRRFLSHCLKRVKKYLRMTPSEVYKKINNQDKITIEEIRQTQRVIKHVVDIVFRKHQADTYQFDD